MKEATGGALLMGLAVMMIMIFVIMAAFFISYGKTFRVKNAIINKIEQSEGMTSDEIKTFVADKTTTYVGKKIEVCYDEIRDNRNNLTGFTMKVRVWMQMDRTILDGPFKFEFPVNGETRIIEKGNMFDRIYSGENIGIQQCPLGYTTVIG